MLSFSYCYRIRLAHSDQIKRIYCNKKNKNNFIGTCFLCRRTASSVCTGCNKNIWFCSQEHQVMQKIPLINEICNDKLGNFKSTFDICKFCESHPWGQFHQSSTCSSYLHKQCAQLFCAYVLGLYFTGARLLVQKLSVEH